MARRNAILIGITGQIGAGKSTVATILQSLGSVVIIGDGLGQQVVDESLSLRKKLAKAFGDDILLPSGMINRPRLAQKAFATERNRHKLNTIVHPSLLRELDRQIRQYVKRDTVIVVDATLLIEWGYHEKMDEVVVVTAPKAFRHRWLTVRGVAPKDIRARERLQPTQKEFASYATKIFRNSGSLRALRSEVTAWLKSVRNTDVDRKN